MVSPRAAHLNRVTNQIQFGRGSGAGGHVPIRANDCARRQNEGDLRAAAAKRRSTSAKFSLNSARRRTHGPPLLEAFAAEHGPALRRTERNRSFLPPLRAGGFGFRALATVGTGTRALRTLGLAVLAPLWFVLKTLVGEEHLFAGGEDELLPAFRALQD